MVFYKWILCNVYFNNSFNTERKDIRQTHEIFFLFSNDPVITFSKLVMLLVLKLSRNEPLLNPFTSLSFFCIKRAVQNSVNYRHQPIFWGLLASCQSSLFFRSSLPCCIIPFTLFLSLSHSSFLMHGNHPGENPLCRFITRSLDSRPVGGSPRLITAFLLCLPLPLGKWWTFFEGAGTQRPLLHH